MKLLNLAVVCNKTAYVLLKMKMEMKSMLCRTLKNALHFLSSKKGSEILQNICTSWVGTKIKIRVL